MGAPSLPRHVGRQRAMLSEAGVVPGPLRWSVGDRVECWWRQSKADEGCWVAGTVVSHWWRHAEWPEAQVAPYQVQLDDGKLIFAPMDEDKVVRAPVDAAAVAVDSSIAGGCEARRAPSRK